MADPKTCGPDPWWLARAADEALTRCEMSEPGPIPDEDRAAAKAAVEAAIPHVELASAESLSARFARLPSPVALDSPEPCGGGGEENCERGEGRSPREGGGGSHAGAALLHPSEPESDSSVSTVESTSGTGGTGGDDQDHAVRPEPGRLLDSTSNAKAPLASQPHPASLTEEDDLAELLAAVEPFTVDGGVGCGGEEVDRLLEVYERLADRPEKEWFGQPPEGQGEAEGHDFKLADQCPMCEQAIPAPNKDGYPAVLAVALAPGGDLNTAHTSEGITALSKRQPVVRYVPEKPSEGQGEDDWPAEFFVTAIRTRGDSDEITGFDAGDVHRAEELRRNGQGPTRRYLLAPADAIPVTGDLAEVRRELRRRARGAEAEERCRVIYGMNGAGPHSAMRAYDKAADLLDGLADPDHQDKPGGDGDPR